MDINDNKEDLRDNVGIADNTDEEESRADNTPDDEADAPELDEKTESGHTAAKSYKNRTLAVAACIFAVTVIAFAVWYAFFNNDITGVWGTDVGFVLPDGTEKTEEMKFAFSEKEKMSFFENEKSYFSNKESLAAKAEMINGGRTFSGIYMTTADKSGENHINMFFTATGSAMTYKYELSGDIFSGRRLVLCSESEQGADEESANEKIVFSQSEKTYALDPPAGFKPNNGVVGTWEYDNIIYTFDSEGRFCEDGGSLKIDGIYSFSEENGLDTIVVKYKYDGEVLSMSIPYLLKGDVMTLTVNGYELDLEKKA